MSTYRKVILNTLCLAFAAGTLTAISGPFAHAQTSAQQQQGIPNQNSFGPRVQKAQQGQQQAQPAAMPKIPPPETVATYDDWKIQCETVRIPKPAANAASGDASADAGGASNASGKSDNQTAAQTPAPNAGDNADTKKFCGMIQSTRFEKKPQIGLTLYISRQKLGDKISTQMKVLAPIGVYLPTGVALEIDGTAISRVPFSNCLPQVCLARGEASPETLDKLKKGNMANFIIYEGPGAGLPMKISLKGFGKALDALDNL